MPGYCRYVRRTTAAATSQCAQLDETAEMAIHKASGPEALSFAVALRAMKDPDVRSCVARALLAIYRSSVSETPPKSCALGIERPPPQGATGRPRGSHALEIPVEQRGIP
eukprot:Skav225220  [mRNA]  locus=scaffold4555:153576:156900:- [translate_table: standard]